MIEELFTFSETEVILLAVTGILFFILLLYCVVTYGHPLRQVKKQLPVSADKLPPVSVIVYSKNESENLRRYLPALLEQDYPDFEVIVVNDGSADESDDVLKTFEQTYSHLYHTYIPEDVKYVSRKKLSLTVAIKAAKHELLIFTEANCEPISRNWLKSIAERYTPDTDLVLGFCTYDNYPGFLHKLIAYDNLLNGLQYLSAALSNHPYTGSGRNLSYRKKLFFDKKGYAHSLNLHAGDDDLFINKVANGKNTAVAYLPDSITRMGKVERYKVWKEMKVSKAATQRFYKGFSLTFYRMEGIFFGLFILAVIASVVFGIVGNWLVAVVAILLYLIRLLVKMVVFHKSAKMLQQKPLSGWIPLLELCQPMFNNYVRIYRLFRGKNDYTFRINK
ncbi:MAG: glycosyltransferase [Tannerellaceae bacterium]|nr:glycosyltransferase [Tannerellaceae bacterium]MCD8262896.1 glycosyltransferase [Tannerellaceae bacterium]